MSTLLLPCDGSPDALLAVRHVIDAVRRGDVQQVHLVNVQPPLPAHAARHLARHVREDFHRERAEAELAEARTLLDSAGVRYQLHCHVGSRAQRTAELARQLSCDRIVLARASGSWLARVLANAWTAQLLAHSTVSVEVVNARPPNALERFGIPTGIGAGLTLLWVT